MSHVRSRIFLTGAALVASVLFVSGCDDSPRATQPATAESMKQAEWPSFVDKFIEDYFSHNPPFAANAGRHEFDGQLPDWSAEGLQKTIAWLDNARKDAISFAENSLTPEQRFQRDYVIAKIDADLFWLREAQLPLTNVSYYFDNGLDPNTYVNVPYASEDERVRAFIRYARSIPEALEQIRENLRSPMPKTFIDYGVKGFAGFAEFYRNDVPQAFAQVSDAALESELKSAIEPAAQAMLDMSKWMESERAKATDSFALGPEKFAAMVRPVRNAFIRLGPATRAAWTTPSLEARFADLLAWRDALYEKHRRD
jgi:hypothetical protein